MNYDVVANQFIYFHFLIKTNPLYRTSIYTDTLFTIHCSTVHCQHNNKNVLIPMHDQQTIQMNLLLFFPFGFLSLLRVPSYEIVTFAFAIKVHTRETRERERKREGGRAKKTVMFFYFFFVLYRWQYLLCVVFFSPSIAFYGSQSELVIRMPMED